MEYNFLVTPDDPPAIIGVNAEPPTLKNFTPKMFLKDVGEAYQNLGGLSWLVAQAQASPGEFMKLLQKMLPNKIDLGSLEGTTIKLIDQFGQSIEVSGQAQPQLPSSTPPRSGNKVEDGPLGVEAGSDLSIETATGVSPNHVAGEPIIEIKDTY